MRQHDQDDIGGQAVFSHMLTLADISLHILKRDGAGPTLVFLHGLGSNAHWWDLIIERLDPTYTCIAVDLRGHGLSHASPGFISLDAMRQDLSNMHEQLRLSDVVLIGHSMGANLTVNVAAAFPWVRGCVLIDGGVVAMQTVLGREWELAEMALRPPTMQHVTETQLEEYLRLMALDCDDPIERLIPLERANFHQGEDGYLHPCLDLDDHMVLAHELFNWNPIEAMMHVQVPVHLILARNEDLGPSAVKEAAAAEMHARFGCTVSWISGVHDLPIQHPIACAQEITDAVVGSVAG